MFVDSFVVMGVIEVVGFIVVVYVIVDVVVNVIVVVVVVVVYVNRNTTFTGVDDFLLDGDVIKVIFVFFSVIFNHFCKFTFTQRYKIVI